VGFIGMLFSGPAAAAIYYAFEFIDGLVRHLLSNPLPPPDRAEIIAAGAWPVLAPLFAVSINVLISIPAVFLGHWLSGRAMLVACVAAFALSLIVAAVLASREPAPEGWFVIFPVMAVLVGLPAVVMTAANSLVWSRLMRNPPLEPTATFGDG